MFLLHAHGVEAGNWAREILLEGLVDTLKIIPFLFLTYLLMEFIEHKAGERAENFMKRAGGLAPMVGGALGLVPQCGFSAAAANLFAGRVISVGTLVAVFLSTSDEMLPIMISGRVSGSAIGLILGYKAAVAILAGFAVDGVLRLMRRGDERINIDAICDEDNCHCERGIWYSALHHTATISLFVLLITVAINALVFFVGEENLGAVMHGRPFISHVIAAIFGLIPNCASSVALTSLYTEGLITVGTMLCGLFSGAGVGILVLFKVNKHPKENFAILGVILAVAIAFGLLGDLIFPTLI